ncbi:MAG: major facilitator superfamily 1 [Firmicutes bacterium]|nr:major facilitator superfamily 1 [Bacillota bacterium]
MLEKQEMKQLAPARWMRIIPLVFITYSLAYLDRANYGFGAAAGLAKDLNIDASTSSLIGALFFLGYFFFQLPGGIFVEKRSAKKIVFWSLILWSGLAGATGIVSDIPTLYVIRFMLGVVESVVMPAMLIIISQWFVKKERSRANALLVLGNPITVLWMSVVSGYLVDAYGWRQMFILEAIPSIIWAVVWWVVFVDRPKEATWLTPLEKKELEDTFLEEQKGLKPVKNYAEALRSPKVITLSLVHFFWNIGMYGFIMWLPSIIKSLSNVGIVATGWLSSVPYALAVVSLVLTSYFSDRTQNRKVFVWAPLLIGTIALIGSYIIGSTNFSWSYFLLVIAGASMYAPYGPFFAIIPEIVPRNVSGGAIAFINSFGALGSFIGAYIVGYLNGITGSPSASFAFMAGSLVLAILLVLFTKASSSGASVSIVSE